jgi:DNA replication and repair protein RecF
MENKVPSLLITKLVCRNFRCFPLLALAFDNPYIIIEGSNGSGKTSLLEAMHYACFGRSFRTHNIRELLSMKSENAAVTVMLEQEKFTHTVYRSFSLQERLVKINDKAATTSRDILDVFRIITLTEGDMALMQDAPEVRRLFLDQILFFLDPTYTTHLQFLKHTVSSRNALISQGKSQNNDLFELISKQLWDCSLIIANQRTKILKEIESIILQYIGIFFSHDTALQCSYYIKNRDAVSYDAWHQLYAASIFSLENHRYKRTLFGAHLDDIHVYHNEKLVRNYSSRGQQKLFLTLFKIAQLALITSRNKSAVLLIDDFILDFDSINLERLLSILNSLGTQLVFTSPLPTTMLNSFPWHVKPQIIRLDDLN